MGKDGFGNVESAPLMSEQDLDEEGDRRVQMEFEQSMRETSQSFFKTAKSTFMSSNDLISHDMIE